MCKTLIHLVSFFLVLCLLQMSATHAADASLVGWWTLNDGSGNVAYDTSGNGNDGTLQGGPSWVAGKISGALQFDGADDQVDCGNDPSLDITGEITIAAWVYPTGPGSSDYPRIVDKSDGTGGADPGYKLYLRSAENFLVTLSAGGAYPNSSSSADLNAWNYVVFITDGTQRKLFLNGAWQRWDESSLPVSSSNPLFLGNSPAGNRHFEGVLDEVRVYSRALAEDEIEAIMLGGGRPYAYNPDPADGAFHADTWVSLSWSPGDSAVSHDVYLGDNFDRLNDATRDSDLYWGNQTATFYVAGFPGFAYPDGLVPGTTYYWRIDEVNEADPNSPWKGDVWSFSIPPKTAYNPNPADGGEVSDPNAATLTWTLGFGAKLHTVFFGDDYDEVDTATVGVPAGAPSYSPGQLESEKVYYWRVDEFDGLETHKGDVWAFTTPGAVGNPQPPNGATDVAMATTLSWTPADNAASHELYFGTDRETVRSADTASPEYKGSKALGAESYDPGLLEADTAYYWRVDEVYDGNPLKGPVWSFTVGDYLLVDDFEGYTDDDAAGEAIWQTWIDGFGIADNGAQVGNLMPPYAEQTIVHGGGQSMPLSYTNEAGVTNSEATMTLTAPRDWTAAGVVDLSLWFRGDPTNAAEPLYAAISNSGGARAAVAYDDPAAATVSVWTQWRVALQALADQSIDLTDVDKIAIGLGDKAGVAAAGGSGTMYVDDIRLYRPTP